MEKWRCPKDVFKDEHAEHYCFDVRPHKNDPTAWTPSLNARLSGLVCLCGDPMVTLRPEDKEPWEYPGFGGATEECSVENPRRGDVVEGDNGFFVDRTRVISVHHLKERITDPLRQGPEPARIRQGV